LTSDADLRDRLGGWLADRWGCDECTVDAVKRHAEGFSWETFTATVRCRTGREPPVQRGVAIRREPEDGLLAPYDVAQQYTIHEVVPQASQVPMPGLVGLELDPEPLGRPFYVMERVDGHVPVQWRPDDPEAFPDERARERLGLNFVDVLAEIHELAWRDTALPEVLEEPADADAAAHAQLDLWEGRYERDALVEVPLLRQALAWARSHVRTSGRVTLVHGDYRIGNFMVRDGRIVAVFDWELAHLSDPVEDIAYSGLRLFRGRSPRFSHLLEPDVYLQRYRERTGTDVDADVLHFWTVVGLIKAAVPHVTAARAFEDGRTGDLRLAAMGHQVAHVLRHLVTELETTPG
jgi:aminoglycoside phosphotransferase (APT) family kinase protein